MKLISRSFAILTLCAAAPLFGAISLVAHTSAASTTGGSVTTSAINTTGANLIVISTTLQNGPASIRDSNNNTWTALNRYGTAVGIQLFYCLNPMVGSSHTFTNGASNEYQSIAVGAFSGVATSSAFDAQNGVANRSSPIQTGSISPSQNGDLLVTAIGNGSSRADSVDSSFTLIEQQFWANGIHWGISFA